MNKKVVKKLFLVFGLILFLIGLRYFNDVYYAILVVLGMILIGAGWKYPNDKKV